MSAADLGMVRRWLADHSAIEGLTIEARPTQQLHDTYFDTDDWRIHRAGFALRVREDSGKDEATLKALRSARTDAADRREVSEPLESGGREALEQSTGPVGARVHAVAGEHPLHALFEVRTLRQRFAVRSQEQSDDLGEIALDETVISRPEGEPQASLQRVEVEALGEAHGPLEKLVKVLRNECALEPTAEGKYVVGLKSVGLAPPSGPQFTPTTIDASMRADEVALAALRRHLSAWVAHEPGARLGDEPEDLHDLRVTARRMDATLSMFAPYLPAPLARARGTLKDLLGVLGAARDFDIQLGELAEFSRQLPEAERAAVEPLRRHLESQRIRARERMLRALDSAATRRWIEKLTLAVVQPSSAPEPEKKAMAAAVAPELVRARFRKLRKAIRGLGEQASMEDYHAVRGRTKKLRYALESVAVMYGKPADEMLRSLRRLQDRLGIQQDAHVAKNQLLAVAADPPKGLPSETLFLMGRLAERHAVAAVGAAKRVDKAWRKVRGRRWKALRLKLEEPRARARVLLEESGPTAATDLAVGAAPPLQTGNA
jgi:triphosphatase